MGTTVEYALMAGASYRDTRGDINKFPIPAGWSMVSRYPQDNTTGFEAAAFGNGLTIADSTEIVISYAGTDGYGGSIVTNPDKQADAKLGTGLWHDQLGQAAAYYLQIRASLKPGATITLTGHSLGGGLASLVAVFFGETAKTFDQAPFLAAVAQAQNLKADLLTREAGIIDPETLSRLLEPLDRYITAMDPNNLNPVTADTLAARKTLVSNINVEGELLSTGVYAVAGRIYGTQAVIPDNTIGVSAEDLHSQALLAAYKQSQETAATGKALNDVTLKLTDLLGMIFNKNLFAHDTDLRTTDENFVERLVKHEATVINSATGETDAMVTRFTSDLWKLVQDGGLTLKDGSIVNPDAHYLSDALIAFAMQKYYQETDTSGGYKNKLFTDLTTAQEGTGGIRFDMADVSTKFATAFAQSDRLTLADAKGYEQYFKNYLQQSTFTAEERSAIASMLPNLRDWYVQAGSSGMTASDTLNRGAFMLGGAGGDTLTGGTVADLLVGNGGNDTLNGGAGNDVLLGGGDIDTLDGGTGNDYLMGGTGQDSYRFSGTFGLDTVVDADGSLRLGTDTNNTILSGGKKIAESVWESDDKQYRFTQVDGQLVVSLNAASGSALNGAILVKNWTPSQLGITLAGDATAPVTTNTLTGDFIKAKNEAGTALLLGDGGINYVNGGVQAGALDLITGSDVADRIQGLDGDDALLGLAGDDVIEGGEGNDVLEGGLGRDTITGGNGNDFIYGSSNGFLTYSVFTDWAPLPPPYPVVLGLGYNWVWSSPGPDADGIQQGVLTTTVGRDEQANDDGNVIDGGAGQDFIRAGTGSDIVHGGADADDIEGMAGNDVLFGDGGNDRIYGDGPNDASKADYTPTEQHGYDVLVGGAGNDLLLGQGKDDILFGGADDDILYGDDRDDMNTPLAIQGNDYLDGGSGNDKLYGNGGDDILIGGANNDDLFGGTGQDTYIFNPGDGVDTITDTKSENNILRFGAGISSNNVTLHLGSLMLDLGNGDAVHIEGFDQNDVFNSSSISSFQFADGSSLTTAELLARGFDLDGTAGNDLIVGTNTTDRINGLDGNDELQGGDGNDVLNGGLGDDLLFGQAGNDQLLGGDGIDHLQGGIGDDTLDGGSGNDALLGEEGNDQLFGGAGVDELQGGDGDDVLDGGADDDTLFGQAGNDVLSGGDGADQLIGGDGNDTIQGGAGNDSAWGEAGDDVLAGGAGNDTLYGGLGNDVYQFGRGDGQDRVYDNDATAGNIDRVQLAAGVSSDEVIASRPVGTYDLKLDIDGTTDALTIANYYFSAADQVEEIRFDDGTVWTPTTIPTLVQGTSDSDVMAGTAGADIFKSGAGNDVMQGGAGNDSYRYFRGDGADLISDYDTTTGNFDKIVFGADIAPSQVHVARSGNDLRLTISAIDSIGVANYFLNDGASPNSVEQIKFLYDDTVWDVTAIKQMALLASDGNDTLIGYASDDTLNGLAGNDTVSGNGGNDTLLGGAGDDTLDGGVGDDALAGGSGNDKLYGGAGNDVYIYNAGDGADIIYDDYTTPGLNTLRFGPGISASQIKLSKSAYLLDLGNGDQINIDGLNFDNIATTVSVGRFEFADGTALTLQDLLARGFDIDGTTGADTLIGTSAVDRINGLAGNDALQGGLGDDTYFFGAGSGFDTITDQSGPGGVRENSVRIGAGLSLANFVAARRGNDLVLFTLDGADQLTIVSQYLVDGTGIAYGVSRIVFDDGTVLDQDKLVSLGVATEGADILQGTLQNDNLFGAGGNDTLYGYAGNDVISGGTGDDLMVGGTGDDNYTVDSALDVVLEEVNEGYDTVTTSVSYTLSANVESLRLNGSAITGTGNSLDNLLVGLGANAVLNGGAGNDALTDLTGSNTLNGGAGDDTYYAYSSSEIINEYANEGTDTVVSGVAFTLANNIENLTLTGTTAINGTGNALDNVMTGNAGNNTLYGLAGNDTLSGGGAGLDTLVGGTGNDTYILASSTDVVVENAGEGTDTILSVNSYTLGANLENLNLLGEAVTGTGNALDNVIVGNSLDNTLDGGAGADTLAGGAGNDAYTVDNAADSVVENAGEGLDSVQSSVSYTLSANVENLTLTGTAAINGTGNSSNNVLTGNSAANVLSGGAGDDTYILGTGDTVVENVNEGIDSVQTALTYTLGSNVENLTLTGTSTIDGTGNTLNNVIIGNTANNTLTGGAGDDRLDGGGGTDALIGGTGNDYYVIDSSRDAITENANEGVDTVQTSLTYTLGTNLENLVLTTGFLINGTGNAVNNVITGNELDNVLDGAAGADTLIGSGGNDTFVVDNAGDVAVENAGEGADTVQSAVSYALSANVENLTLTGTAVINGTGNNLSNTLTGNSAANVLTGGAGDDTYVVGAGDTAIENANEGTDTVQSSVTFTLDVNLENLTLTGATVINGTGNSLNNTLAGDANTKANILSGGLGDDTYIVGSGDTAVENANEGIDSVFSAVAFTLGANLENLTLTGTSAVNGTGNDLNNVLTGNSAANVLTGGARDDLYIVSTGDSVVESAGQGVDTVRSDATFTLGANVENLTLTGAAAINGTGNGLDNALIGNAANNLLDGGAGADSLAGGAGDDTYVVDNAGDIVVENAGEGNDTVQSYISFTDVGNIENVTLLGTAAINATTGAGNNVLTGNSAANVLTGGAGDDTYVVGAGDSVVENANEGIDTVQSAVTYTLDANVENLTLTGTAAINATGNGLGNVITGNAANNVLDGGLGADTLYGGGGNDTLYGQAGDHLYGGAGDDLYVLEGGGNMSSGYLRDDSGIDTLQSNQSISLWEYYYFSNSDGRFHYTGSVENATLTGIANADLRGTDGNNILIGNGGNNFLLGYTGNDRLEGGDGNDYLVGGSGTSTLLGGAGNDTLEGDAYVVGTSNMSGGTGDDVYIVYNSARDIVTENLSEGVDRVEWRGDGTYTLTANIENVFVSSANGAIGNTADNWLRVTSAGWLYSNTLSGLAGNDTLDGGDGADILIGGTGNDTYIVDNVGDVVTENLNEGIDIVNSSVTYSLAANVENLKLTGTAAINGTGNALNNILQGNSASNTLMGGTGNDTYLLSRSDGSDTISENDAATGNTDLAQFGTGIATDQLWFRQVGNNLEVDVIGTSDSFTVNNWYLGSQYHVEQFKTSDGKMLLDSQVQNLVQAMASFAPPAAGQTTLPTAYANILNPVIVANWH